MRLGIAGMGAVGLACAAWAARRGHPVTLWSPRGGGASSAQRASLQSSGLLDAATRVDIAGSIQALAQSADALLIAMPVNGHRTAMSALAPHLRDGQTVIVSSMSSLSSLYLFELLRDAGRDVTVASFGTTVLTARRTGAMSVRIVGTRTSVGVSTLPCSRMEQALALCHQLFGGVFTAERHALASALININPTAHVPLALFNWTRVERAESWPQFLNMTPMVAAVIEKLDAERLAVAQGFGLSLQSIEHHFARSYGTTSSRLADIAAELHSQGDLAGPADVHTRYLDEDVPFGLAFVAALGRVCGVATPASDASVQAASLIAARDLAAENDLLAPLGLQETTRDELLARVGV